MTAPAEIPRMLNVTIRLHNGEMHNHPHAREAEADPEARAVTVVDAGGDATLYNWDYITAFHVASTE